jgi:hypothetical protein
MEMYDVFSGLFLCACGGKAFGTNAQLSSKMMKMRGLGMLRQQAE